MSAVHGLDARLLLPSIDCRLSLADIYDKDVRTSVKSLTSVFEPAVILVMGIIVGTVVLSMLTAIFSINEIGF